MVWEGNGGDHPAAPIPITSILAPSRSTRTVKGAATTITIDVVRVQLVPLTKSAHNVDGVHESNVAFVSHRFTTRSVPLRGNHRFMKTLLMLGTTQPLLVARDSRRTGRYLRMSRRRVCENVPTSRR